MKKYSAAPAAAKSVLPPLPLFMLQKLKKLISVTLVIAIVMLLPLEHAFANTTSRYFAYNDFRFQSYSLQGQVYCHDRLLQETAQRGLDTSEVCQRALPYFEELCERGNLEACENMASLYAFKGGVGLDTDFARVLYQSICKQGRLSACFHWRQGLSKAELSQALQKSAARCEKGAQGGCVDYALGLVLGLNGYQDFDRGIELLETACNDGNVEGCYRAGTVLNWSSAKAREISRRVLAGPCRPDLYEPCRDALKRFLLNTSVVTHTTRQKTDDSLHWGEEEGMAPIARVLQGEFEQAISEYQTARTDQARSSALMRAFTLNQYRSEDLEQALNDFVEAQPKSHVPFLYRASYLMGDAAKNKGAVFFSGNLKNNKQAKQDDKLRAKELLEQAKRDLQKAMKLDKKDFYPPFLLSEIAKQESDKNAKKLLKRARSIEPFHIDWWRTTFRKRIRQLGTHPGIVKHHEAEIAEREKEYQQASTANPLIKELSFRRTINPDSDVMGRNLSPFGFKHESWFKEEFRNLVIASGFESACHLNKRFLGIYPHSLDARQYKSLCDQDVPMYAELIQSTQIETERPVISLEGDENSDYSETAQFNVVSCESERKKEASTRRFFNTAGQGGELMDQVFNKHRIKKYAKCVRDQPQYAETAEFFDWRLRREIRSVAINEQIKQLAPDHESDFTLENPLVEYGISADTTRLGLNMFADLKGQADTLAIPIHAVLVWKKPNGGEQTLDESFAQPLVLLKRTLVDLAGQLSTESLQNWRGNSSVSQLDYLDSLVSMIDAKKIKLQGVSDTWSAYVSKVGESSSNNSASESLQILIVDQAIENAMEERVELARKFHQQLDSLSQTFTTPVTTKPIKNSNRDVYREQFNREMQQRLLQIRIKRLLENARK